MNGAPVRNARLAIRIGLLTHAFFAPVSIAGTQIGLAITGFGLCLAALRGWRPWRTPLDLPLAAFVAACVLSDVWSPFGPPDLGFATLWRSVAGVWIVAQALAVLPEDAGSVLSFEAAGLAAAAAVGILQYRTGFDLPHALGLRENVAWVEAPGVPGRYGAMGFFISRLTFGHNATLVVATLAGGLARFRQRALPLAAIGLGLVAIGLTFDRAAYLGLFAAALVLIAVSAPRARPWLAGALAAALLAGALHPGVRERFRSSFDASRNADRVFLWERAREIVLDHPLRGIGFGNYPRVCGQYYDRVDPGFPMRTWAHNTFISLYAETGPLGLAAFVWVLLAAGWAARREPGALAAICAFVVIAQFHDVLYDTKVMYPLWLAIGLALRPQTSGAGSGETARAGGRTNP